MANNSFIITGAIGAGKSSLCLQIVNYLRPLPVTIGGVITIQDNKKFFYLVNKNERMAFEAGDLDEFVPVGRFKIHKRNLGRVLSEITKEIGYDYFFIDEIGYLELEGGGYFPVLKQVFKRNNTTFVVVKKKILEELIENFPQLKDYHVIIISNKDYSRELNLIKTKIVKSRKQEY
ncbi:MAG: nucleoside-triphosphatase [Candidatus Hodarchaeales archaeon]